MLLQLLLRRRSLTTAAKRPVLNAVFTVDSTDDFRALVEESRVPVSILLLLSQQQLTRHKVILQFNNNRLQLNPVLESLVRAKKNKVRLVKLDPSFMPEMAQRYQVEHFPTLMLLKDGQVVEQWEPENNSAEEEEEFVDKASAFASLNSMTAYRKRLVSEHEKTVKQQHAAARFRLAAEQMQEIAAMFHWIDLERKKEHL